MVGGGGCGCKGWWVIGALNHSWWRGAATTTAHANTASASFASPLGNPPSLPRRPMQEELLAADVANALHQMHAAGRYGELLLVADTCQASTLYSRVTAPNVLAVASSKLGEWAARSGSILARQEGRRGGRERAGGRGASGVR